MAQNHVEEQDGCDHGATGKACKADPSPNGKDCQSHGNHGGVNEDHCLTTSSTTSTTATTVTTATTTGTTETTATTTPTTTTTLGTVTTTTNLPTTATVQPTSSVTVQPAPVGMTSLPVTGFATFDALALGLGLVIAGLFLRRRGARRG